MGLGRATAVGTRASACSGAAIRRATDHAAAGSRARSGMDAHPTLALSWAGVDLGTATAAAGTFESTYIGRWSATSRGATTTAPAASACMG